MITSRQGVLVLGEPMNPSFEAVLKSRRLTLTTTSTPTADDFRGARGIVMNSRGKSVGSLKVPIEDYAETALSHGLQVVVRIDALRHVDLQALFPDLGPKWTSFDPSRDDEDLAEVLRGHDPGPAESGALDVPPLSPPLEAEDQLLLRRAFGDCDLLTLKEITDGRSKARVLRVHARRAGADPPSFLLPFLIKIDAIKEIDTEIDRYEQFVAGHIPFTQRPNLDSARSVKGLRRAVMVSDFVEDAVSLSKICDRPEGRRVIYSLFDDGLRSWRRHADAGGPSPALPITDHLHEVVQVDQIPPEVSARARRLGLRATPKHLMTDLAKHSSHRWRLGTIHGDLHPGNVMVRAGEAILIDFASIWDRRKPLVADLACLEVGMCFTVAAEGCVKSPHRTAPRFNAWRETIDALFSVDALRRVPSAQAPGEIIWLWEACRQTRSMASHLEPAPSAYASALALYLLRRARLGDAGGNPAVEAYALIVAERIIRALKAGKL